MNIVNFINVRCAAVVTLSAFLLDAAIYGDSGADEGWKRATSVGTYQFPQDHFIHHDFKTEWWYFTGTLRTRQGREYGYELTFFRQGVLPPAAWNERVDVPAADRSRFVQRDFKFAHFAISDLGKREFHFTQKISRGAFADAGFAEQTAGVTPPPSPSEPLAWIDDWSLRALPDGSWKIEAKAKLPVPMLVDLTVSPAKAPVIQGIDGVSQKAAGEGNASYYYSFTRLRTIGTLAVADGQPLEVTGESWFDHEWASNQLAADQIGWDWFCCQFDDQTELMLYAMRRRDGTVDPISSGTLVTADGEVEHLKLGQFKLQPLRTWHSPQTGADYPLAWRVEIPSRQLTFTLESRLDTQELVLPPVSYWEGAIAVRGRRGAKPLSGHGYMELTGYAGALKGLQERQDQPAATSLRGVTP